MQTKRGTEQFERQLRQDFTDNEAHGMAAMLEPPTFAEYAPDWLSNYVDVHNRPSTRYSKRTALRCHVLPEFGHLRLSEITAERLDVFAARLREADRSPKTVNNILSMIRSALTVAKTWGLLRELPTIHWQRIPVQGYRFLEPEHAKALLSMVGRSSNGRFWYTLILFFLRTGGRFSEIAVLTWKDLVIDDIRPHVRFWRARSLDVEGPTKTNRCRDVPLAADLLAVLREFPRTSERVFNVSQGAMISANNLYWKLAAFCRDAGIPRVSWKDFRHTFATDLTRAGVPLNVVSHLLGHTTLHMTMRYAHAPEQAMYDAVQRLVECQEQIATEESRWNGTPVDTNVIRTASIRSTALALSPSTTQIPAPEGG